MARKTKHHTSHVCANGYASIPTSFTQKVCQFDYGDPVWLFTSGTQNNYCVKGLISQEDYEQKSQEHPSLIMDARKRKVSKTGPNTRSIKITQFSKGTKVYWGYSHTTGEIVISKEPTPQD